MHGNETLLERSHAESHHLDNYERQSWYLSSQSLHFHKTHSTSHCVALTNTIGFFWQHDEQCVNKCSLLPHSKHHFLFSETTYSSNFLGWKEAHERHRLNTFIFIQMDFATPGPCWPTSIFSWRLKTKPKKNHNWAQPINWRMNVIDFRISGIFYFITSVLSNWVICLLILDW